MEELPLSEMEKLRSQTGALSQPSDEKCVGPTASCPWSERQEVGCVMYQGEARAPSKLSRKSVQKRWSCGEARC